MDGEKRRRLCNRMPHRFAAGCLPSLPRCIPPSSGSTPPPPPCRCSESSFTNFQTMWVSNDGGFNEARRAGDRLRCWTPTDADLISDFRCCAGAGIRAPMEGKRVGRKRGPAHSRLLAG